jgi:2-keto-4-pentenoate hydratase/2-oxohepta-3-ene-1,7-dioic acid hydratase in catechol pathway
MRFVFYNNSAYLKKPSAATLGDSEWIPLDEIVKDSRRGDYDINSTSFYSLFNEISDLLHGNDLVGANAVKLDSDSKFDSVSASPRQIIAVGINYVDHAEEMNMEVSDSPVVFTKFQSCIAGANAIVELPNETVDYENELTVVIGKFCSNVSIDNALDYVAGVTVGEDISDRTLQFAAGSHFSLGKSYHNFGPIGPELVTLDEIGSLEDLYIKTWLNGELVQDSSTSQMIFKVDYLVSYLSSVIDLYPGDVIFTGSPAGVGFSRRPPLYLRPGDILESEIEKVTKQTIYFR